MLWKVCNPVKWLGGGAWEEAEDCSLLQTISQTISLDLPTPSNGPPAVGVAQRRAQSLPPEDPPPGTSLPSHALPLPKELSKLARTSPGPTHCFLEACSPVAEETAGFWDMVARYGCAIQSSLTLPPSNPQKHLRLCTMLHHCACG